jgi:hypothetical protein
LQVQVGDPPLLVQVALVSQPHDWHWPLAFTYSEGAQLVHWVAETAQVAQLESHAEQTRSALPPQAALW